MVQFYSKRGGTAANNDPDLLQIQNIWEIIHKNARVHHVTKYHCQRINLVASAGTVTSLETTKKNM